ncbi:MAG: thiol:disulfide interchange protein DsbA/DsbL [Burkholderiales bacterium]
MLARLLAAAMLVLVSFGALAQKVPVLGREYQLLEPPRPVATGSRIEVIEFFYYGCPICYEAQPHISRWLMKTGPAVTLRRVPAVSSEGWEPFAKTYYALETTGLLGRLHWPVYDNHHFDGKRLNEVKNLLAWLGQNGVDATKFAEVLNSQETAAKVAAAQKMLDAYKVRGVPSFVIDGKYVTSARMANGVKEMMEVVEYLVQRAAAERK